MWRRLATLVGEFPPQSTRSLRAPVVLGRGARRHLHRLHLLEVLGIERLLAAECGLGRNPVFGGKSIGTSFCPGRKLGTLPAGTIAPSGVISHGNGGMI